MDKSSKDLELSGLRQNYLKSSLRRKDLTVEPLSLFQKWFAEAINSSLREPNAMILGTVKDNAPSSRTVLLKRFDNAGAIFYTNYKSKKARDIEINSKVSLLFPWYEIEKQVIILGNAERISREESLIYFKSRPIESQLGAWVSEQSDVITSRNVLERKLEESKVKFGNKNIPIPEFWGGFRVKPLEFEFWQGRENRLHDRFRYKLKEHSDQDHWEVERLSP